MTHLDACNVVKINFCSKNNVGTNALQNINQLMENVRFHVQIIAKNVTSMDVYHVINNMPYKPIKLV